MFSSPKKVQPQLSIDYPVLPTAGGDLLAAVLGCGSDAGVRVEESALDPRALHLLISHPTTPVHGPIPTRAPRAQALKAMFDGAAVPAEFVRTNAGLKLRVQVGPGYGGGA